MESNFSIEGNKIIRDFIGKELHDKLCYKEFGAIDYSQCEGLYNSSWNWLMEVIEKISHIKVDWQNATDTDTYYPRTFGMLQQDTGLPMVRINANSLFVGGTLMEATFLAVVDFIQYHNNNQIKTK